MNMNFTPEPESVIAFLLITTSYLALITLVTLTSKTISLRFIGLGLLTAIASVGYAGLIPMASNATPTMMKIAFLLVLAGVFIPFFNTLEGKSSAPEQRSIKGEYHD